MIDYTLTKSDLVKLEGHNSFFNSHCKNSSTKLRGNALHAGTRATVPNRFHVIDVKLALIIDSQTASEKLKRMRQSRADQTLEGKYIWVITLSNISKDIAFFLRGVTSCGFRKLSSTGWYKLWKLLRYSSNKKVCNMIRSMHWLTRGLRMKKPFLFPIAYI